MATVDDSRPALANGDGEALAESTIVRQMAALVDQMSQDDADSTLAMHDIAAYLRLLSQAWPESACSIDASTFGGTLHSLSKSDNPPEIPLAGERFEVRRMLGHGGFGVVLLAFDKRLAREVALKIPRPEILVSHDMRRRFLREAQAAAALDHANIVPVFDTGDIGPIWFITSRYIAGPTLAEWLREQESCLSPQQAAELIAILAEAMQHAHARGVLHRDLKPANVLLEPSGQTVNSRLPFAPRLSDFGLARRLDEGQPFTRNESLVGTPRYMAPEQAACRHGDVGIQTDVYGLGAILFELLAGRPPFAGSNDDDTLQQIVADPVPVDLLAQRRIPRDLQAICLKSLEKESSKRYSTASAMSGDLRNFLNRLPVDARPVGRFERLTRWCQRRPMQAALCATLCLITLLGIVGITWQWIRAEHSLLLARNEFARAEKNLRRVEVSSIDLAWIFEEAELWSGNDKTFPLVLAEKLNHYANEMLPQYAAREGMTDPILAAIYAMQAKSCSQMHKVEAAEEHYRKSIGIWRDVLRNNPDSAAYLRAMGVTLYGYGNHLLSSGTIKVDHQGENLVQQMFLRLKLAPDDEVRALKAYAHMMSNLGLARKSKHQPADALAALEQSRQAWHELSQRLPDARFGIDEATVLLHIATNQNRLTRNFPLAIQSAAQARRIMESVVAHDGSEPTDQLILAGALRSEARLYARRVKPANSVPLYEREIRIRQEWTREHPDDCPQRELLGKESLELAQVLTDWKKLDASLPYYQLTAEHWETLLFHYQGRLSAENENSLAVVHCRIGEGLTRVGRTSEAIVEFRRSIGLAQHLRQRPKPSRKCTTALIQSNIQLGDILVNVGQQSAAAKCYQEGIQVLKEQLMTRPDNLNFKQQLESTKTKLAETESRNGRANSNRE